MVQSNTIELSGAHRSIIYFLSSRPAGITTRTHEVGMTVCFNKKKKACYFGRGSCQIVLKQICVFQIYTELELRMVVSLGSWVTLLFLGISVSSWPWPGHISCIPAQLGPVPIEFSITRHGTGSSKEIYTQARPPPPMDSLGVPATTWFPLFPCYRYSVTV